MSARQVEFDPVTIQNIFGHEAAETEDTKRLKEYYFKSEDYSRITADLPLRILVGHKGIGKSALFKVAYLEDKERHRLSIWIRPDDILDIGSENNNFLEEIRDWKAGLNRIITDKVLDTIGVREYDDERISKMKSYGSKVLSFLRDTIRPMIENKITLEPAFQLMVDDFLASNFINVYIDDLDRGWSGKPADIRRISALLNALRDLSAENPGLQFRVALRSDVYFLVRTADESTDKTEMSVVWQSWTNHGILALLVKRIETFFGRAADERALLSLRQMDLARYLNPVMETKFTGRGKWEDAPMYRVLMSLIRKRPRDLVKLCSLAASQAHESGHRKITTADFTAIFESYSQGRLQDTFNEYRTELPNVEALLMGMKPTRKEQQDGWGFIYKTDGLLKKLQHIMSRNNLEYANHKPVSAIELAQFLYKINFLTARKELSSGQIQRRYFEEQRYIYSKFADFGYDWEVHPAYRWALQPNDIAKILYELDISDDD